MDLKKGKSKRKSKGWGRNIFIFILFLFLFFRKVPSMFASSFKTVLPEKHIIENRIKTEAIIIRKEKLYRSMGEGRIKTYIPQGDRVALGVKIASLSLTNDNSYLKQELDEIEKKIDSLKRIKVTDQNMDNQEDRLAERMEDIIDSIQESVFQSSYDEVKILKDKLIIYEQELDDFAGNQTLIHQTLENLEEMKEEIQGKIKNNVVDYYAAEPGIVSYNLDGYEEIYSATYNDYYKYADFKTILDKQSIVTNNDNIRIGEPIFKIIDNYEWYMVIKIEDIGEISDYDERDSIIITDHQIEGELKGYIEKIYKEKGKGLILVKFDRDFQYCFDKRSIEINIIKYRNEVYRIPSKAIIDKNNVKGVFIRELSGIVRFRPIDIVGEEGKDTYIDKGDKYCNIFIEGSDESVRTVQQFDEILLNTSNVKDGMITN